MARPFVLITDSFKIFRDKVNTVSYNVGDPDLLNTYADSDLVESINEIENVFDASAGEILYPTGAPGETETRLLISTAQSSGTDIVFQTGNDFFVNASNDIILDAGNDKLYFKHDSATRFDYTLGAANTIDITGSLNQTTSGSTQFTSTTFTVDASGDINLDADGGNVVIKDGGVTAYDFASNGTISRTGDVTFDITGDFTIDADGGDVVLKDGGTTFGGFTADSDQLVIKSGTDTAITFIGADQRWSGNIYKNSALTFDVEGDIIFDANAGNTILKDGGTQYAEFSNVGNELVIKSGTADAITITSNNIEFNRPTHTDSDLNTDATNIAGGINELETASRGANGTYTLETTAQNFRDAINEHERDLYDSGVSFTGVLSANNFKAGVEELIAELGDHTTLTTTATTAITAINELDAEMGDSDVSAIAGINNTVKGALRQLHTEVGDVSSLAVKDSEGGTTTTVTELTTAANKLDSRLDVIEGWTDQDVQTTASPTFNQVTTSKINRTGSFTIDASVNITLDADGGIVYLKDGGTTFGSLNNTSGNLIVKSGTTTAMTFDGANVTMAGTITPSIALGTSATTLAAAINEIHSELDSATGELETVKDNLQAADTFAGKGTALNTTATTLASAINEHETQLGELNLLDSDYFGVGQQENHINALNALATDIEQLFDSAGGINQRLGDLGDLIGFFDSAGVRNTVVNALNHVARRTVLVYDASGTLLNS